jgi:hypothetical protein
MTVHFLVGLSIRKEKSALGYRMSIDTSQLDVSLQQDLRLFLTGDGAVSQTRSVRGLEVNLKTDKKDYGSITLCDTPGMADTGGVEVDILNGQLVLKALRNSRSVKFLFFLSFPDRGNKFQGIKLLPSTLLKFIPNLSQDVLNSVGYVFTRFDPELADTITNQIVAVQTELTPEERVDKDYMLALENMRMKTNPRAMIIQPDVVSTRPDLLDLIDGLRPLSSGSVSFKNFASLASLGLLKDQLHFHKDFILKKLDQIDLDPLGADEYDDEYEHLEAQYESEYDGRRRQVKELTSADQKVVIAKLEEIQFLYEALVSKKRRESLRIS